jgi:mannose-6-phosphate isomerase-like protein (cupin superfamily)
MPALRPPKVGAYELLEDFEAQDASIRVIKMGGGEDVQPHIHQRCAQIYLAIEGEAVVVCDGVETRLHPYRAVRVPRGSAHGVRPINGPAIVANISVPPLQPDDQVATLPSYETADMRLPGPAGDVED